MSRLVRSVAAFGVICACACSSKGTGNTIPTSCFADTPAAGSPCSAPDGTTCIYGDTCNPITFVCMGGAWKDETTGGPPGTMCPPTAPPNGDVCAQCSSGGVPPSPYACSYDTSCGPDGGSSATATCTGGHWLVVGASCTDGGPSDAAPDARDGASEAAD